MIWWWRRRRERQSNTVTVMVTGPKAAVGLAKSLLDSAGIQHEIRNEPLQDFFGWGRIGSYYNLVLGPVTILVSREDADVARELLSDIEVSRPSTSVPWMLRLIAIAIILMTGYSLVQTVVSGTALPATHARRAR